MFNYFFGSDNRSIPYLEILYKNNKNLKVITTPPVKRGRGNSIKANVVEKYCKQNNISIDYFKGDSVYLDMEYGLCVSFKEIFTNKFVDSNNPIYNIHLSLLPMYRGPSPVETAILENNKDIGYTIFKIAHKIDTGEILIQRKLDYIEEMYASRYYELAYVDFENIIEDINLKSPNLTEQNTKNVKHTKKFNKQIFDITNDTVEVAKNKIRAFDTIGPAFVIYNQILFKVLSYSNESKGFKIELSDGVIYPETIIPEGKKKMNAEDYIRGLNDNIC